VCPGTKRALGGGVVQYGPADDLAVNASGPLDSTGFTKATVDGDTAKQWYAAVQNRHSSTTTRTFRVFAICSGSSDAGIRASSFTVNHNKTGEADAVCPGNMRALGGGVVEIGSPKRLHVRASGPLDSTGITNNTEDGDIARQWYAAVANFSAELRTFKVFAICE
jgi:hypothetical protein